MGLIIYKDPDDCIVPIIEKIGNEIVIAVPLGLGKPVQLLNAFYNYSKHHPHIQLTLLTALSLIRPIIKNDLEKRLVEPILNRLYGHYIDLEYEIDRRNQQLPPNVKVIEFYLTPGEYLNNSCAQQDYISSNYTHVIRDLLSYNINIIGQLISCKKNNADDQFSLGCNCDITLDLIKAMKQQYSSNKQALFIGEINSQLPYMYGESAEVSKDLFFAMIDNNKKMDLYVIPRPAITQQDFMIGLYTSCLIKDNGCLQIGIGSLSDALVNALVLRHNSNQRYLELLEHVKIMKKFNSIIDEAGETSSFKKGLFGSTEMLVDGFLDLYKNGILKKRTYDDIILQTLLNNNLINENITEKTIDLLIQYKRIAIKLTSEDVEFLKYYGIINDQCYQYREGHLYLTTGEKILADLSNPLERKVILEKCLGNKLKNGRILHAGFFIGSTALYQYLLSLDEEEIKLFDMRSIKKINQLYGDEEIDALQRINARFVNSSLKVTLLGSVISDHLENGIELSGVGGQYNFVAMAHELPGGRSIINCRSTYNKKGKLESNIVWDYGNATIPRHLRDIVVTEYGIADCRSRTDSEVIKSLLNITDSRFQDQLLAQAKKYNKIPNHYQIPDQYKNNFPKTLSTLIASFNKDVYRCYPFGSELTNDEIQLKMALNDLKTASYVRRIIYLLKGLFISSKQFKGLIKRMDLECPTNLKEYVYRWLVLASLKNKSGSI
jgi:acyl-CoA hydrolase